MKTPPRVIETTPCVLVMRPEAAKWLLAVMEDHHFAAVQTVSANHPDMLFSADLITLLAAWKTTTPEI